MLTVVCCSPDGKYVAAALLDCTVKLFHEDSLKFFLSLYGHRLPVLSMDISSDGTLLASAGADKNLKIWGLDFGDCHKSLLAHDDSVMGVRFVPDTHYVFTCGKDKLVRYWDADKFEMIYSLPAHQSEVWALAVSRFGQSFVSAGNDRSMRLWEQTDEQVFLDEERDERLEELFDEGVVERQGERPGVLPDSGLAAPAESVAANATASLSSVKAGEKLMQALDAVELELKRRMESGHAATENPLMRGLSPSRFLLQTLRSLRPSELEVVGFHQLQIHFLCRIDFISLVSYIVADAACAPVRLCTTGDGAAVRPHRRRRRRRALRSLRALPAADALSALRVGGKPRHDRAGSAHPSLKSEASSQPKGCLCLSYHNPHRVAYNSAGPNRFQRRRHPVPAAGAEGPVQRRLLRGSGGCRRGQEGEETTIGSSRIRLKFFRTKLLLLSPRIS